QGKLEKLSTKARKSRLAKCHTWDKRDSLMMLPSLPRSRQGHVWSLDEVEAKRDPPNAHSSS
ncbi:hypothetical protein PIB30_077662, partial [Stylosanthes scabra]|nr:hypothetical protein [Stylosanthes scabra]